MSADGRHTPICINCQRDEFAIPVTQWRMAEGTFWLCPDCLPLFIHRRDAVMRKWKLTNEASPMPINRGESHA